MEQVLSGSGVIRLDTSVLSMESCIRLKLMYELVTAPRVSQIQVFCLVAVCVCGLDNVHVLSVFTNDYGMVLFLS